MRTVPRTVPLALEPISAKSAKRSQTTPSSSTKAGASPGALSKFSSSFHLLLVFVLLQYFGGHSFPFTKDLFSSLVRAPTSTSLLDCLTSLSATAAKAYIRPGARFSLVTIRCIYFYLYENMWFFYLVFMIKQLSGVFFFPSQK